MRIIFSFLTAVLLMLHPVAAQDFSGLARIDASQSQISDRLLGGVQIELQLSQGVPYRVYTLTGPPRLVLDFQEVDWTSATPEMLLTPGRVTAVRFGALRPGWSRLVADLAEPLSVTQSDTVIDDDSGAARITLQLGSVSEEEFVAQSGAPDGPDWQKQTPADVAVIKPLKPGDPLVVVIDPGHGGVDPGAERGGLQEKELMLTFARELREALLRAGGFQVVLTREADRFVALDRRIAIAHQAGGHVFLSLHADALAEGGARGATVHLLSDSASDEATAKLAERHNRADVLSGVDLTGADDQVTGILLDLARQETKPRTASLADHLVAGLQAAGGPMNRKPLRQAGFSVLKSADIPSVLIELGFLSSKRDLKNLSDPAWRAKTAAGLRDGLQAWRLEDDVTRPLVRQ